MWLDPSLPSQEERGRTLQLRRQSSHRGPGPAPRESGSRGAAVDPAAPIPHLRGHAAGGTMSSTGGAGQVEALLWRLPHAQGPRSLVVHIVRRVLPLQALLLLYGPQIQRVARHEHCGHRRAG